MNPPPLTVLYEDNHLLVVTKPAGLPTMGTPGDRPTLLAVAKEYVKQRYQKPGNVYLGVVSRLDAPVTGVVLLGPHVEGRRPADRAVPQRGPSRRRYWAVVEGRSRTGRRSTWSIGSARTTATAACTLSAPRFPARKRPGSSYRRLAIVAGDSLAGGGVGNRPQASDSARSWPITAIRSSAIASTAAASRFPSALPCTPDGCVISHPTTAEQLEFEAPLPDAWRRFGIQG